MTIKQQIAKFFQANPSLSKDSGTLYSAYKVKKYTYDEVRKQHNLTVIAKNPNSKNQNNYQLERNGDLHPELIKCLRKREEIVYFWTGKKLEASDLFCFEGGGYYWTVFPKKCLIEKQKAQKWLDENYPKEDRGEIEKLEISGVKTKAIGWKLLEGHLDLQDFANLKYLDCSDNQLTSLNINNCSQLEKLYCSNNLLKTDANSLFSNFNPENLKELDLANNCFKENDLKVFKKFTNLEILDISNNDFVGSLDPLQKLNQLKELNIANTNIKSGLDHLPDSLEKFHCYDPDYERETLKSTELYKKELQGFNDNLKTWKEFFNSPARKWLDKEYPEREENSEESLGLDLFFEQEEDVVKERKETVELDISNKSLKGPLRLKGFTDLEILDCSNNQLTKLNLSDCPNLIELNISHNEFRDLEFLKSVPKLKKLSIANNQKLFSQDLRTLTSLKDLKDLDTSNCLFKGSLKNLKGLTKLTRLNISNTDISEGLEYLPKSCEALYCNSDYQYKSTKIMEELDKSECWDEKGNHKYYIPVKWREFKEDGLVVSVIPLERLFVIRNNIKRFIKKWGQGEEIEEKRKKEELSELSKLQSPQEFNKYWYTGSIKWVARIGATTGGILALNDNAILGGIFAASFPLIEVIASRVEEKFYDAKQKKWEEFIEDAKDFLDNYHELVGMLKTIQVGELGEVNKALNDLNIKVGEFIKKYDNDQNESIDVFELKEAENRKKLGQDLNMEKLEVGGSQLGDIVLAMKKLEKEIIRYRQGRRGKNTEEQTNENIHCLINVGSSNQEIDESNSQIENNSDDESSSPILNSPSISKKNKKPLSIGNNSFSVSLTKRGKNTNFLSATKALEQEVNETYELKNWESQDQNNNGSSSKYNAKIEITPK